MHNMLYKLGYKRGCGQEHGDNKQQKSYIVKTTKRKPISLLQSFEHNGFKYSYHRTMKQYININFCYKLGIYATGMFIQLSTLDNNFSRRQRWLTTMVFVLNFVSKHAVTVLEHPPYFLELSPVSVFPLFPRIKKILKDTHFENL